MIIGTAGHVNHGKTTLVEALTGVNCDRLDAERERGITIELGFAEWLLPDGRSTSVVDVPGHARLAHTMATGALGIEAVLLVVAADEGLMPQTHEHLLACRVLGVEGGVVAVTHTDQVSDPAAAVERIRAALSETHLAGADVVPVCAPRAEGLEELGQAVARLLPTGKHPESELPLMMPVDRAFSVRGFGTVLTGSLMRGSVAAADTVELLPSGRRCRVRGLHVHNQAVDRAQARCRVALNLVDVHPDAVPRGSFVSAPGQACVGRVADVALTWLDHMSEPLDEARSLGLVCGAARARARVVASRPIDPGQTGAARLYLDREIALLGGLRFVLRGPSDRAYGAVVGGGRIIDARPPRRRSAAVRRALLEASSLQVLLEEAGAVGVEPELVGARLGIPPLPDGPRLFAEGAIAAAAARAVTAVAEHQERHPDDPGLPASAVRLGAVSEVALDRAVEQGRLVRRDSYLRTPEHATGRDAADQALAERAMATIAETGLAGPREQEIAAALGVGEPELRRSLRLLEGDGRILRISGLCFPMAQAMDLRQQAVEAVLAGQRLPVSWLKETARVTRKHAIPLWTWLDRIGVTKRDGNLRIAGPAAKR